MNKDLIAVLDLGSTKAACLVVEEARDGLEVIAASSVECKGLRKGVVTDLDHTANSIDLAIRQVQQEIGEEIESVVVGIGGSHLECVNTKGIVPIFPLGR